MMFEIGPELASLIKWVLGGAAFLVVALVVLVVME